MLGTLCPISLQDITHGSTIRQSFWARALDNSKLAVTCTRALGNRGAKQRSFQQLSRTLLCPPSVQESLTVDFLGTLLRKTRNHVQPEMFRLKSRTTQHVQVLE